MGRGADLLGMSSAGGDGDATFGGGTAQAAASLSPSRNVLMPVTSELICRNLLVSDVHVWTSV